ncbi:hypothetical protein ABW21_db0202249 [Orbilia brochopaga]|nr:hypothetical protein ABW21_db0202249 [Drechslerella brochopaga]
MQSPVERMAHALFTPSGNLLASSAAPNSADAKKARVHAALAANIWTQYERVATDGLLQTALSPASQADHDPTPTPVKSGPAASRMIGRRHGNGEPSSSSSQHSEGSDHDPGIGPSTRGGAGPSTRPPGSGNNGPTSTASSATGIGGGGAMGVLKVTSQTLVDYLQKELKYFEPPEDL